MNEKTPISHLNDEGDDTSNSKEDSEKISVAQEGEDNINDSETPKVSNQKETNDSETPKVSDKKETEVTDVIDGEKSPGSILRQAREKGNMSIKHISDRLFLDKHVIQALEDDNYEGLPPPIFVRGYLRNYAKVLDIPEENILAVLDQNENTSTPSITKNPLTPNKQTSSNDLWHSVSTVVVIVTLMILMALWQFYPSSDDISSETPGAINSDNESWPSDLDNTEINAEINTVDETAIKPAADNASTTTVTTTTVQSPPAVITVIQQTENTPAQVSPVLVNEEKTILLHFKKRVWMRVTDKTGKQLYEGISKADKALSLEGLPPFNIKVGNSGVDIEYQGEIKNIRNYPKENKSYIIGAVSTGE
ncbi:MAG: DUF4115 domain-containing protein [Thiomargarita sp.]|nr:DUF4115 domain-containing protein [Thiomargarita sp.]